MDTIKNAFIDAYKSDLITAEEAAKGISDASKDLFDKEDREANKDDEKKCATKIWNLLKGSIPSEAESWRFFVNNLDSTPKSSLEWYGKNDKKTSLKKISDEKPEDSDLVLPINRATDEIVAFNKSMKTKRFSIYFTYTIQSDGKMSYSMGSGNVNK